MFFAVRLQQALPAVNDEINYEGMDELTAQLKDVMNYLVEKEQSLFSTRNYGIAPPDYHRRAI